MNVELSQSKCVGYRCCVWLGFVELGDSRMRKINSPEFPMLVVVSNLIEDNERRVGNNLVYLSHRGKRRRHGDEKR